MRRGLKSAPAIAEQNGEIRRLRVRNHQVKIAIAIEIAQRNVIRKRSGRTGCRRGRTEVPLAIAEEHRHGLAGSVGDEEVQLAVMIYIGDGDGPWALADGQNDLVEVCRWQRCN